MSVTMVIDFNTYINEKTHNFTGRNWVFERVNNWIGDQKKNRFLMIIGNPGCGKTAIAARLKQFSDCSVAASPRLNKLTSECISAAHFCSARDRRWINPHTFAESLALQLSARYPTTFAKVLAEKSGDRQIYMEVSQIINTVENSQVTGIIIHKLDVSGILPEDAFIRVVREPLEAIFEAGFNESIIIVVDALDESLVYSGDVGIVSLLAHAENLPEKVRFILTSRWDDRVLNQFYNVEQLFISDEKFVESYSDDIVAYVKKRLHNDGKLFCKLSQLSQSELNDLVDLIRNKAEGNFQYVVFLFKAVADSTISLNDLEGLPKDLFPLYHDSLDRLVKLGKKDWLQNYAPLLGVLSVAQESLTLSLLEAFTGLKETAVWTILGEIQQFVEKNNEVFKLYHQSLIDFLHQQLITIDTRLLRNSYYLPKQEWHRQIAHYYWKTFHGKWKNCDDYGLNNLAIHLFKTKDQEHLTELISKEWMEARYERNGFTHNGFLSDIELSWKMIVTLNGQSDILALIKLQSAKQMVFHEASFYTNTDLQTLVWLGRKNEALAHARLRVKNEDKLDGLIAIFDSLQENKKSTGKHSI